MRHTIIQDFARCYGVTDTNWQTEIVNCDVLLHHEGRESDSRTARKLMISLKRRLGAEFSKRPKPRWQGTCHRERRCSRSLK